MRRLLPLLALALLAGCAGTAKKPPAASAGGQVAPQASAGPPPDCTGFKPYPKAQEDLSTRGDYVAGGLYKPGVDDSTPDYLPNVACIPEPAVVDEPRSAYGNRSPYQVLGKSYRVLASTDGFVETGLASYYGNKFHGRRTSNHEVYDMYAFTAAHKSLPLPSFARVTNLDNGRSVVVRVNDRGPFHEGRVIDLSYAAAVKLDIHRRGTGRVEVRALRPADTDTLQASVPAAAPAAPSALDALVGRLPPATPVTAAPPAAATTGHAAPVSAVAPTTVPAGRAAGLADHPDYGREQDRFRLVGEDGRVKTADDFDAWMRARQARLDAAASGRAVPADARASTTTAALQPAATTPAAVRTPSATSVAAPAPTQARPSPPAPTSADGVTLQVGVFSVRDNAERALAALHGAGIPAARMQDVVSAGRTLWRVRVGPVADAAIAELSSRVTGLGLGVPRIVRE
ncbi:septal ring lytic transglycosylase RlpA family protein [Luteimonas viscosa]|uniref:Endolytic peptidoglycan transglycosylase RlpA n=1 Tax=Luteimonas viscosa TaxID=1132694 RepID=A0A5D4XNY9_9GAMM|nr:septal ring lytic transglycosylase RlpA family protein [Luteimonas viscosa]TYT25824.1 septal ring lytic transglycosylase RlpA family protein [Luteimonas viscosa]